MANPEHLEILNQGVEKWNQWREDHPEIKPDLSEEDIHLTELSGANLSGVDLSAVDCRGADLRRADLSRADLTLARLENADLRGANLSGADIGYANLNDAVLSRANFSGAIIMWTTFGGNDLSSVKGPETVNYMGPSTIGIDTLYQSGGKIPEAFLLGCGVPEQFITFIPSLVGAVEPFQYHSCFISYSTKDEEFAKRLHSQLRKDHPAAYAPRPLLSSNGLRFRSGQRRFAARRHPYRR